MDNETKLKLMKAGREDLIATSELLESGYAGIDKTGKIVDRRIDKTAVPMPYNSMFPNTPPPKPVE